LAAYLPWWPVWFGGGAWAHSFGEIAIMPEVYFELSGDDFAVDAAIVDSPLREYADIHRRGEATGLKRKPAHETSGLQIWVGGDEEARLEQQISEALEFLHNYTAEIRQLRGLPGISVARLRFGDHWPKGICTYCPVFPSALLLVCGELGLDIVLCQYLLEKWLKADQATAEPGAVQNGGPAAQLGNSKVTEGPPSVS